MGCASSRVSPAAEPAVTDVAEEAAMAEKKARVEAAICAYRRAAAETAAAAAGTGITGIKTKPVDPPARAAMAAQRETGKDVRTVLATALRAKEGGREKEYYR